MTTVQLKHGEVRTVFSPVGLWSLIDTDGTSRGEFASKEKAEEKLRLLVSWHASRGNAKAQPSAASLVEAAKQRLSEAKRAKSGALLYDLSRTTKAMHRLATKRHGALITAGETVDTAMMARFGDVSNGEMMEELWGRLYEPTAAHSLEAPRTHAEKLRETIHETLDGLDEWAAIQATTRRNAALASVSAKYITDGVIAEVIAEFPEPPEQPERDEDGDESSDGGLDSGDDETAGNGTSDAQETLELTDEQKAGLRAKLAAGLREAAEETDKVADAMGLAAGDEAGGAETMSPDASMKLASSLSKSSKLVELLREVGSMLKSFRAVEATEHGKEGTSPFSVTPGNDIRKLLPMELLGLAMPQTSLRTMRRLINRETLTYEVRSREPKEDGPFVVCLDRSGSMQGRPMEQAKAFAVASLMVAHREGRDVHLVSFDTRAKDHDIDLSTPDARVKTLTSVASIGPGGGTSFNRPLTAAKRWLAERDGADILFISDGEGGLETRWTSLLKEAATKLHYIHIGYGEPASQLAKLATRAIGVSSIIDGDAVSMAINSARGEKE